ncbi:Spy/CpxP family protein refolding chaperone [Hyphomicrobium sp.]|uniref:Spy/CpxP family protein refolding chaperone n=1 Tax=Hyphomicrobium sp. TaxID=82 RepID=UPI002E31D31F|nr:Spy/CpxP family protein refolding chaperone [Hyphomicrobium sp.]HEX2843511.1 Spy/CpxP family protein refolding chaperone [Hyphomicrobium sp.]
MTGKRKYILAGVAAAAVGLAAAGAIAQRAHYWDGHKGRHFGHGASMGVLGLGFGGPHGRICRADSGEFADIMLVRLEHRINPTEAQKGAFEDFKVATRAAAQKLSEGCPKRPEVKDGESRPPRSLIDRLNQTQTGLEASLDALKTYRPAAEKFYASLSDEQKTKLSERRRGGERHWNRDRGPGGKPDNEQGSPTPNDKG